MAAELDMSPHVTVDYRVNRPTADAKSVCQLQRGFLSSVSADFIHGFRCQFGAVVAFAASLSALAIAVSYVVLMGTEKQMGRIATGCVVAPV